MGDSPAHVWTSVWCLRPYHWVYGQQTPDFQTATDGRLLDFKGKGWAVATEIAELKKALASLPNGAESGRTSR
jgi:hypothetical protein